MEHFNNINQVVQRMKYVGATLSGKKSELCVEEAVIVGHRCTPEGRRPEQSRIDAVEKWGPCKDLSYARAFIGTIGVARMFIHGFAKITEPIVQLTCKDVPFEFGPEQLAAQQPLKKSLIKSPALCSIDYQSDSPVILAVDTSYIAIGFLLCQCNLVNPRKRYYSRFGSITLNDRERGYSQPKLELYGLYRTLATLRLYLLGVRNLIIEVDAWYIKGMLEKPDIIPSVETTWSGMNE
jgi:hypothetical protein